MIVSLSGCATLGNAQFQPAEQLVVEFATLKVIDIGSTTAVRQARADKIRSIAADAKAIADTGGVAIAAVQAAAMAAVAKLNLAPADQFLADALIQTVVAELQARVGAGVIPANALVQVDAVLGWVITAASLPVS